MTTPNWKHWLLRHERAVAALERNPPRIAARIHRVSADELVEFCRVHEVDPDRITAAIVQDLKRRLGIIAEGRQEPAAAKPAPAPVPAPASVAPPVPAKAPVLRVYSPSGRRVAAGAAAEPWLSAKRGPYRAAVEPHLERLRQIAAGGADLPPGGNTWGSFARKWLGTAVPTAEQASLFLAWLDARSGEKREVRAEKPERPVRRAVRAAKPERAPVEATSEAAPAPDGWAELDVKVGNYMEHDARYSGAAVKLPNVSIAAACVRRLSLPPQRYRVLWHGSHGRLAFVPAPRGIVFRPQRSGGVRVICQSLPTLLGRGPKNFRLSESPTAPGAFVELEEVRS